MVTITSLWLAILMSAIFVWIASFIVWSVLPHHKSDFKGLPNEEAAMKALRSQKLTPGQYSIPHLKTKDALRKPGIIKKFHEGPTGFLTILPKGMPPLGKNLGLSFIFYLAVGLVVAYLTSRTLETATPYLQVFRVAGTIAWLAYGGATIQEAIWFGRPWKTVLKQLLDALIFGLLTGGVFGWLWPQ